MLGYQHSNEHSLLWLQGCQPCETKNRETVVQKSGEIFRIIKPRFFMNNLHTVSLKFQFYEFGD
jgi:hypothetical protein